MSFFEDETEGLDIAVVGIACRVPGALDAEAFWKNLSHGYEALTWSGLDPPGRGDPNSHHVPAGFLLDEADCFDAAFFSMSPREAALTDPQHRILMECAYEALENAGHACVQGADVGVYVGCGPNTYLLNNILCNSKVRSEATPLQILIGNEKDYLANRISYKLDLRGPSVVVQSACSTSLLAVHVAARALFAGECDMALAGGVSVEFPQDLGYIHQQGGILSPDGHCRPFSAEAGGTVPGNGVGLVVLRRLAEALADSDTVYAVIRGTATNNDGAAKVGYAAPSIEGQSRVIRAAQSIARVEPRSIGYVEAHGTGTALGDPVEMAALAEAFGAPAQSGPCVVGAVKAGIGHLDAAAGVAGLIKAVLALHHGSIPPTLHCSVPHPAIDFAVAGFLPNAATVDWPRGEKPRRAAVSSFGIGGSNVHVVLEEAPPPADARPTANGACILRLSALTATALKKSAKRLAARLEQAPQLHLDDVAFTLHHGRRAFGERMAVVAETPAEAARLLRQGGAVEVVRGKAVTSPRTVFMFPGQGTQYPGMAAELHAAGGVFARQLWASCEMLRPLLGLDLLGLLYPESDAACREAEALLAETWLTQPALFAVEHALACEWMTWGLRPVAMIGHSLGEYVAACLASVMGVEDALRLVAVRGRLMQAMAPGSMLAVNAPFDEIQAEVAAPLSLAAVNRPSVCVVSGPSAEIAALHERLSERGVECQPLATSHAFHSQMMSPCCAAFETEVSRISLKPPRIPFISCLTGQWITDAQAMSPGYWAQSLRGTVRFADGVSCIAEQGGSAFVECGPGRSLSSAVRDICAGRSGVVQLSLLPSKGMRVDAARQRLHVRAQLWCHGLSIDPPKGEQRYRRVALPGYPFERRRHWIERSMPAEDLALPQAKEGDAVEAHADADREPLDPADRLAKLWCNALGVDAVHPDDDFFALGGDSILSIQIAQQASAAGISLRPRVIMQYPTIAKIIQAIADAGELQQAAEAASAEGSDEASIPAALVHCPEQAHEPFPLTDIQHAYWVGRSAELGSGTVAAHAYEEFECEQLDVERLQNALRGLIARHQMMRAVITPDGRQQILSKVPAYTVNVSDLIALTADEALLRLAAIREYKSHQVMDCERWPLFDVSVTRMPDGSARLHVSFDLLITDAWSITIFWRELERRYLQPDYDPPPLPVSFRDYVLAEVALQSGPAFQRSRHYWLARTADFPNAPSLPLACAPEAVTNLRFVRRERRIGAEAWQRLKQRAASRALTPSVLLSAAYAETLAAWSETPRFCLNLPAFNRLPVHPDIGEVMGDFTSVLLLEVDCGADVPFLQRAQAVQKQLWEDIEALQFSGINLLSAIGARRQTRPKMPYVFTSLIFPGAADRSVVGRLGRLVEGISQTPQVWLDCQVYEDGPDLVINWDSVRALFDPVMLDSMFAEYAGLLQRLADDDDCWISVAWRDQRAERLIRPARRAANQTRSPGSEVLLHSGFLRNARQTPDALALVAEGMRLSYAELDSASRWLAAELLRQGAATGAPIAVVLPKCGEQVVAVLGILRAGLCYVPVDPALPRERLHELLGLAGAAHAITSAGLREALEWPGGVSPLVLGAVAIVASAGAACEWTEPEVNPNNLAYIIFTSGTTGVPKGVMTAHQAAANTIADINDRFSVGPGDKILGLSSLSFDLSAYDIFGALAAGACLVLPRAAQALDPACWEQLVRQEGVTLWNSVPALADLIASHIELHRAPALSTLRLVMMSGDWIALTLPPRLRRVAPAARQVSLGGATEASIWSICHQIDQIEPWWRSVPYGRALANQTFDVLDAHLRPRPDFVPGELFIGGVGLAEGYIGNAEETAQRFLPHPRGEGRLYRTGDIGRWLPDGTIEFLGRKDSQVKINGFRVEIGEIEKVACVLPCVGACAVVLAAEPGGAHRLVAYACPGAGTTLYSEALKAHLAAKLPAYMVPSVVVVLPELPLSSNGKVDRARLPAPQAHRAAPARKQAATSTERALCDLWAAIVGHEDFGVTDTFFETGGDSRQLTELVARIRASLYEYFPLRAAFLTPSVRDLARVIDERQRDPDPASLPGPHAMDHREARVPLTSSQARLWFYDQLAPGNSTYNIVEPFHLRGALDVDALRAAFEAFARRHDALGMAINDHGAGPYQRPGGATPLDFRNVEMLGADARRASQHAIDHEANAPFRLGEGPNLRVRLLRFGAEEHTLVVSAHHIVWDGWSTVIMVREVGTLYRASVAGGVAALPALKLGFADVALWEEAQTRAGSFKPQLDYWCRQLASPLPVLALPVEGEIAPDQPISGERIDFMIDAPTTVRFKALCSTQGATVFMGYLAAWTALLQWWCQQRDIIVGVPAGHRAYPQLADTVGFLVNSLAIRTRLCSDPSFTQLLGSVRDTALQAYAHQDVPFDQVVEAVRPARRTSASAPIYRAWFVLHDVPLPDWDLPGVQAELLDARFLLSVHDIKLSLVAQDGGMEGGIDYRTGLFGAATMQRLAHCFGELVALAASRPETTLTALNGALDNLWNGKGADAAPGPSRRRAWSEERAMRVSVKQGC
jgi:amino acid adenylation domain-containing protein